MQACCTTCIIYWPYCSAPHHKCHCDFVRTQNTLSNWIACADFTNVVAPCRCYAHAASDVMFRRPAWLCLHFASCIMTQQNVTFLGVAHPGRGGRDPKLDSAEIFVQCTYPQVSSSYVCLFESYRVDKQTHTNPPTNKQTPPKTSSI